MSIRKVIGPESGHRNGNNDKVEVIEGGEQTRPIPFLTRMSMVFFFICFMLLLGGILFCIGGAEIITVNPGESIQEAINNLPDEGGIIELAAGIHEIDDTMYPPGGPISYSLLVNKSNVTITGTYGSIVRHHNKSLTCFFIPDLGGSEPPLENITFRNFSTTSTYTKADNAKNYLVSATHVKNFTVECMHDTSWALNYVGVWSSQSHHRYSENVSYKNNILDHCGVSISFTDNVYILNNTILGSRGNYALCTARNLKYLHIIGNRVINAGANSGLLADGPKNAIFRDNFVQGSQESIRISQSVRDTIIENNTFIEASRHAIGMRPQREMKNVTIRNNLIYKNNGDGIWIGEYPRASGLSDTAIINNVIFNNNGDGVILNSEYWGDVTVRNNIVANNSGYGISIRRGSNLFNTYNNVWGNTLGSYNNTTVGTGDISEDPLFVDAANNDLHLESTEGHWNGSTWVYDDVTSPCVDAGNPASDYSNEPEPNGGRINIGAYGNTEEASKSSSSIILNGLLYSNCLYIPLIVYFIL